MKRINIDLENELHTKAKVIAFLKNMTMKEYIQKALEEATKRDSALLAKVKT